MSIVPMNNVTIRVSYAPRGNKGNDGITPVKGVDYDDGLPGYTPIKGVDYDDGAPGYTPVKGVDYFDGDPGYTPVKGIDYFDGNPGYTPIKNVDYFDGADGALNAIPKTTNITAIDDTGIADGEIMVANLTGKKIETSNVLIGDLANKLNILSDTTYNADWIAGTPAANAGTNVITLVGHGLVNTDAIEFDAGTGALPTGILQYNADTGANNYYNVIQMSGDTFKICATVGGATEVDITSTGTAGWRIRKAGVLSITISGLSLATDLQYEIFIKTGFAKRGVGAISNAYKLNNDNSQRVFGALQQFGYAPAINFADFPSASMDKYTMINHRIMLTRISASQCNVLMNSAGVRTLDKSTMAIVGALGTQNLNYIENLASEVTTINIAPAANGLIVNGTRIIVYRR